MQNSRLIHMKSNLQMYDYKIEHVRGKSNFIADVLSVRPLWVSLDSTPGPEEGLDLDESPD